MEQNAPWWFVYVSTWLDHMMPRELTIMISDQVCDYVAMREEINITHEWWIECDHSLKWLGIIPSTKGLMNTKGQRTCEFELPLPEF